jgi:hypothetical protein
MAEYEFWLTDDAGRRLKLLTGLAFVSYTRSIVGLGTVNFGLPFQPFNDEFKPYFKPDWRLEAWRSPKSGTPLRREDVFLLRKPHVYVRDDGSKGLQFYGRNGLDLLYRRSVIQSPGTSWTKKTDFADDMAKEIVREQMLYGSAVDQNGVVDNTRAWPQNEFLVQGDASLGPTLTRDFEGKQVIDILKEIKAATFQLNLNASTNRRILFSVEPFSVTGLSTAFGSTLGWQFRTYADLYGQDRTGGIEFSEENENIEKPSYSISHLDEVNTVYVTNGQGSAVPQFAMVQDADRAAQSRWNRVENMISASSTVAGTTSLQDAGYAEIHNKRPVEEFPVTFLNTTGSNSTPQSLYGIDWDLGDLLRVNFAGKQFSVEVNVVYVSVDENGVETITGRNEVNAASV